MVTGNRLKEKIRPFAQKLRGVAHAHRLAIVYLLAHDPKEVWEVVEALGIGQNLAAHHLKYMKQTGWVKRTRIGKHVTYELEEKAFAEFQKFLADTPFFRQIFGQPPR